MPTSAAQQAYFERNTQKPANIASWMTFTISHPDWSDDVKLVAITENMGVEYDPGFYTFEGVTYRPVSMSVTLPNESKDSNGGMTLTFARAGSEVKKRMKEITHTNARVPKTFVFKQYQEGVETPVRIFNGVVALDYPKVSGTDVAIQADIYNPNLLTSKFIATLDLYPELEDV